MPKNEEGEFELILGNRQLLSVFFVVVVLLGVFFAMGYIVGRNSSGPASADAAHKGDAKPIVVERASPSGTPVQPGAPAGAAPDAGIPAPAATSAPVETPAVEPPAAEPPHKTKAETKQEPKPEPKTEPKRSKPEPASPTPDVPSTGSTYLQVAAVAKAEAELFVDVLAKKGFHALYTPVPDKATFRVLVGPYKDSASVSQARADLNKAGFKGFDAILRKY